MMSTNSHFEHVLVFKTFMPLQVLTSGMVYVFDCASFTILRLNIKQQRKIDKKKKTNQLAEPLHMEPTTCRMQ